VSFRGHLENLGLDQSLVLNSEVTVLCGCGFNLTLELFKTNSEFLSASHWLLSLVMSLVVGSSWKI